MTKINEIFLLMPKNIPIILDIIFFVTCSDFEYHPGFQRVNPWLKLTQVEFYFDQFWLFSSNPLHDMPSQGHVSAYKANDYLVHSPNAWVTVELKLIERCKPKRRILVKVSSIFRISVSNSAREIILNWFYNFCIILWCLTRP